MTIVVQPITLQGRIARLEPLAEKHAPDLHAVADPALFAYSPPPVAYTEAGWRATIQRLQQTPAMMPFAIVVQASGTAVGVTTYMDVRPEHDGLEIGSTWLAKAHQGTAVNPECKFLLLRHAFEVLGAMRVQIKTDSRNQQSQRAIEKLGAVKEGILRKHMLMWDGVVRDTVMYSITDDEWQQVKAGLIARLGYAL